MYILFCHMCACACVCTSGPCDTPADVPNNLSRATTPSVPSAREHAGYANMNAAVANRMERDVSGSAVAAVRV